jgi:sec-independent protein translocase protein TatB
VFNFSGSEIVFLLLIALIVLGPEKLPEAVRKFGKTYGEFKKMTTGFQSELKSALDEPMREMRETADAFKKAASFDFDSEPESEETKAEITSAAGPEAALDVDVRPTTPAPPATASPATFSAAPPMKPVEDAVPDETEPEPEPELADEPPAATGLDALVIRDAPVQQAKPVVREVPPRPDSAPESPSIAGPVTPRTPRKNTAASFRRAPKSDEPSDDDGETAAG